MEQYLTIGKIVKYHGIKGEVKVLPLTENIKRFSKLDAVFIEINQILIEHKIDSVRYTNDTVIIKFEDINSISDTEPLKGCYIKINRENAIKLPKGTYFISDLIGIDVSTENEYLGKIIDILQSGGNDIYVVKCNDRELLIPAIKEVVKEIDINNKVMLVKLLEGLREL